MRFIFIVTTSLLSFSLFIFSGDLEDQLNRAKRVVEEQKRAILQERQNREQAIAASVKLLEDRFGNENTALIRFMTPRVNKEVHTTFVNGFKEKNCNLLQALSAAGWSTACMSHLDHYSYTPDELTSALKDTIWAGHWLCCQHLIEKGAKTRDLEVLLLALLNNNPMAGTIIDTILKNGVAAGSVLNIDNIEFGLLDFVDKESVVTSTLKNKGAWSLIENLTAPIEQERSNTQQRAEEEHLQALAYKQLQKRIWYSGVSCVGLAIAVWSLWYYFAPHRTDKEQSEGTGA